MQESDPAANRYAMLQLLSGGWVVQAIFVAAKLGIADLLEQEPLSALELAHRTDVDPDALYRVLRALATIEIFAERPDGRFALTPLAAHLSSRSPTSLRAYAIMQGEQWCWRSWGETMHSVRTGEPAFAHVFGESLFDYYRHHPDAARTSTEALSRLSELESTALGGAIDCSVIRQVVDVGGGRGALLARLLAVHPHLSGSLLELPHNIDAARSTFAANGMLERCALVAGDFFTAVPPGADLYILKRVLHDWDDAKARAILRTCRAAMNDSARLVILEHVVPLGNAPSYAKWLDLLMLVYAGGRERTAAEFEHLLASAGFRLNALAETGSKIAMIEAVIA